LQGGHETLLFAGGERAAFHQPRKLPGSLYRSIVQFALRVGQLVLFTFPVHRNPPGTRLARSISASRTRYAGKVNSM
jgi:hypothetical protein